ncbi:metal ABC transporter substrate-binding protein [Clostridium sp. 'White wine YQ']|uniref:metal ABC transporter substrate-binding protein n=1 Tax=Clostridium sp. 'White wine YQ' TaxID=3027474 RepID=UPI0023666BED|nr:zinc ABC transporter substrate-binding protein [Clostridium sp. 'White wine YQ']MDD7794905.1 zinc ABC transporter substrate-binding protein [Clostridium sp. 'White wine YQ']
MRKKSLILVMIIFSIVALFSGCSNKKEVSDGKINVIVSFNPLKDFTEAIGGDKVNVESLVPGTSEPHDFEPKTKDFAKLTEADIFIYSGLGLEDWIEDVKNNIGDSKVKLIEATEGINVLKTDGATDPHAWLSLIEAQKICENIKNSLQDKDPKNKEYYETRYKEYKDSLQKLYDDNIKRFNVLNNKDFITSHEAFGYLCRDFNLQQKSLENLFGEGENTPQKLAEIVTYAKTNKINTIFMENSGSEKDAETISRESGSKIQKIYTLETREDNLNYLDAMKENLDRIYNSLSSIK